MTALYGQAFYGRACGVPREGSGSQGRTGELGELVGGRSYVGGRWRMEGVREARPECVRFCIHL